MIEKNIMERINQIPLHELHLDAITMKVRKIQSLRTLSITETKIKKAKPKKKTPKKTGGKRLKLNTTSELLKLISKMSPEELQKVKDGLKRKAD